MQGWAQHHLDHRQPLPAGPEDAWRGRRFQKHFAHPHQEQEVEKTGEPGCSWRGSVGCRCRGARLPQRPPSAQHRAREAKAASPPLPSRRAQGQHGFLQPAAHFFKRFKRLTGDRASTLWFTP